MLRTVMKCFNCKLYLAVNPQREEGEFVFCKCGFVQSLQHSLIENIDVESVNNKSIFI